MTKTKHPNKNNLKQRQTTNFEPSESNAEGKLSSIARMIPRSLASKTHVNF